MGKAKTVEEALSLYTRGEKLTGENQYRLEHGPGKQDYKMVKFGRVFPNFLSTLVGDLDQLLPVNQDCENVFNLYSIRLMQSRQQQYMSHPMY